MPKPDILLSPETHTLHLGRDFGSYLSSAKGIRSLNVAKSWPVMQTKSRRVCSVFHGHWCLWYRRVKFHLTSCVESMRNRSAHVSVSNMMAASTRALNSILWERLCSGSLSPRVSSKADGWNSPVPLPVLLKKLHQAARTELFSVYRVWSPIAILKMCQFFGVWNGKWQ